jgi:hypothetical protein
LAVRGRCVEPETTEDRIAHTGTELPERTERETDPGVDQTQAAEPVALDVHVEVLAELGLDAAGEAQVGKVKRHASWNCETFEDVRVTCVREDAAGETPEH